ncbi:hypothetical protein Tco_0712843 [Tanacetum coccineum]
MSSAEAEYVAAAGCCAQVFWIKSQLANYDVLYDKEMVRAALATLGLVNENDTSISSTDLANSSPLKMRYFSPIWKVLMLYIVKCLGGEAYKNDNLKTFKPYHISATSFKTPFENEVPLTAYMCKVTNISPDPIKSLIPPYGEVITNDIADKSLSRTNVQPVTLESSSSPQVTDTQPAKELATIANATQSINAFKSAKELGNHLEPVNAEKVQESIFEYEVKDYRITSIRNISFEELFNQHENKDADKENYESPFDIESKIKFIGKEVLMTTEHKEELSKTDEDTTNKVTNELVDIANSQDDNLNASANKPPYSSKFDKHVKKTLKAQVPDLIQKPLNKELNALNTLEYNRMADLQKKPIKEINTKVGISVQRSIRKEVKPSETKTDDETHTDAQGEHSGEQAPLISTALVVQSSEEKPPVKKVKLFVLEFIIISLTPLNSIMPLEIRPLVIINNIPFDQCTTNLFSLSSSKFFSNSSLIVANKGKDEIQETSNNDKLNQLMPFMDEGGLAPKMPNLQQFGTSTENQITIKDVKAQMEEIKRLTALKHEKEEYEKRLKVLTPKELEVQAVD